MENIDLESAPTNNIGELSHTPRSIDEDDEEKIHDQLPSVEEYKTSMAGNTASPRVAAVENLAGDDDGNDDEHVHDQLPSVEEAKAVVNPQPQTSSCRLVCRIIGLLIFLGVIASAIVVPVVVMKEEGKNPWTGSRRETVVDYLVSLEISSEIALNTPGTPQYEAATWIADDDRFYMPLPKGESKHNRFVERYSLAVLYYATDGPRWSYKMRFLDPIDHCQWFQLFRTSVSNVYLRLGVNSCSVTSGTGTTSGAHVAKLGLPLNNLNGELPEEIGNLNQLEFLSAQFNPRLGGSIGFGMLQLEKLRHLELHYCALTGSIPDWIGEMNLLTNLSLGNNFLTGNIPERLFDLTLLDHLALDDNEFSGNMASFGKLTNLERLYLEDNSFTGTVTENMPSGWSKMKELDLSKNQIDSEIPSNIFSMPDLEILDLNGNQFKGSIPEVLGENTQLSFLALHNNELELAIPESITKLSLLEHLDLSGNKLVLPYPDSMNQLTGLRYLFTGNNDFGDHDIPKFVTKLTKLRELSMKNNNLTGQIPTGIAALSSLQVLDLDSNKLTGQIPAELGVCKSLDYLFLNRNNLNGTIPEIFALMHDLDVFLIDGNDITGNADVICKDDAVSIGTFVSDCAGPDPEIECSCCTSCCNDSNTTCNNYDWNINLDPIWEYSYERSVYTYGQELLPEP